MTNRSVLQQRFVTSRLCLVFVDLLQLEASVLQTQAAAATADTYASTVNESMALCKPPQL